jgi:hypothetical protein
MTADVLQPTIPGMTAGSLPEAEQPNCARLGELLSELNLLVGEFAHAVDLVGFSHTVGWATFDATFKDPRNEALRKASASIRSWANLGARSAVLSVFNFGDVMAEAKAVIRATPTLEGLADWKSLKEATKAFSTQFAKGEQLRHLRDAISHSPFITRARSTHGTKPAKPGGPPGIVRSSFLNSVFGYTWKGEFRGLEITPAKLTELVNVRDLFYFGVTLMELELRRSAKDLAPR